MSLAMSLVKSAIITLTVWCAVVFQPAVAEAPPTKLQGIKPATTGVSQKSSKRYLRPVIHQQAKLESVPMLWREFEKKILAKEDLPKQLDRFLVLYRNINSDFTRANVMIGFEVEQNLQIKGDITIPSTLDNQLLLMREQHSALQMEDAWQDINFRKPIEAIVETHFLNPLGQTESSQLVVYYQ